MSDIPADQVLDCGCIIRCMVDNGIRVMMLIPCRENCEVVRMALEEADEQNKPVEIRRTEPPAGWGESWGDG